MEDDIRKITRENANIREENAVVTHDIRNVLAERNDIIEQSKIRDEDYHIIIQVKLYYLHSFYI